MDELERMSLRPPKIVGDVTVARYLESLGTPERWRVSINGRTHFLTEKATALRIRALALEIREGATYVEIHAIYEREMGSSAESIVPFVRWCETHRQRLEKLAETPDNHALSSRCSLLSSPVCERIGKALAWLFMPSAITILASLSLTTVFLYLYRRTPHGGASVWVSGAIALMGVLFHELGHITACVRHRAKQGGIGIGLYWIWPVFFADVRGSWALSPSKRLQVSIGGLYFQSIYAAVLALVGIATGSATMALSLYITLLLMGNTLNPILKYDGYWILSDWLNITNLHTQIANHLKALCKLNREDGRVLLRSRMTLVVVVFVVVAIAFVCLVLRSLIAAGAYTVTELSGAAGGVYRMLIADSSTSMAFAAAIMDLSVLLLQLAFVVMGVMLLGIRSVQAALNFASTTPGRT